MNVRILVMGVGLSCAGGQALGAVVVDVPATVQGIFTAFGQNNKAHNAGLGNVQIGWFPTGGGEFRADFVFDLSGVAPAGMIVTGATMTIAMPFNGYLSPDATETMTLFDVDPAFLAVLTDEDTPVSGRTDIFADLGSGAVYGERVIQSTEVGGALIDTALSGAPFLANVNDAIGGRFAIGAAVTSFQGNAARQTVFAFSGYGNRAVLSLTFDVPAPGVGAVAGMACLLAGRRRRR
jgi:hypothetical protein